MADPHYTQPGQPESGLKHLSRANKILPFSQSMLSSLAYNRERAARRIRARMEAFELLRLTQEERAIRQHARSQLASQLADPGRMAELKMARILRAKKALESLAVANSLTPKPSIFDPPMTDPAIGELWWASTTVWWNIPALVVGFEDDGLHFGGDQEINDGDLWKGFIHVFAQFGLEPARMPPDTNVISTPLANITGPVKGLTISNYFDFGDQWSKCWLTTRQTVLSPAETPPAGEIFAQIVYGDNINTTSLIFIESSYEAQFANLPGLSALPPVKFALDSTVRSTGIEIDLEFNIDVQMEGDDSHLTFGLAPEANSDVIQPLQWKLQPA